MTGFGKEIFYNKTNFTQKIDFLSELPLKKRIILPLLAKIGGRTGTKIPRLKYIFCCLFWVILQNFRPPGTLQSTHQHSLQPAIFLTSQSCCPGEQDRTGNCVISMEHMGKSGSNLIILFFIQGKSWALRYFLIGKFCSHKHFNISTGCSNFNLCFCFVVVVQWCTVCTV